MNKMAVVKWYDPDTVDTVLIAAQAYGIQIKRIEPTGTADETYVCVYGPTESVNAFTSDVAEGDVEPFDLKAELSDDEYQEWLAAELSKFGCLYIPKFCNDDEGDADED